LKPCLNSKNTSLKATTKLKAESNCDKKNLEKNKIKYYCLYLFLSFKKNSHPKKCWYKYINW